MRVFQNSNIFSGKMIAGGYLGFVVDCDVGVGAKAAA